MWNQIFPQTKVPYYSYSNKRKQELAKLAKYKLFILLLTRFTYRIMRESIQHIQKVTCQQMQVLQKAFRYMKTKAWDAKVLSFQRLRQNGILEKAKQNTIKNVTNLLERILKYKLKKTFSAIQLFGQRKNQIMITNVQHMRKIIFCKKIQRVFIAKKRSHFIKMIDYSIYAKKLLKKVKIAGIIGKQYVKNVQQACFNRISKITANKIANNSKIGQSFGLSRDSSRSIPVTSVPEQKENKQLKLKLQDMSAQLQNKNDSISRLEQQIQQLKMQQPQNNYNSFSEYGVFTANGNRSRSILNYNSSNNNRSRNGQNDSLDSGMDFSLGSILGNSFSLNKSRSKEMRKGDSIASVDCNCSYKQKYVKYKNSNESLKNQLQIVKEQLDVAKDLNDHFTNEIRQYFGGQKGEIQLDRLRKESKDLQRERDELRIKVTKYQHHITTLKCQFKLKIEELYRKVKKER